MKALADNGADIIELGAPFTDPMADGVAVQKAGLRALASGTRLIDVLALARRFRAAYPSIPVILMGYANPIFSFGYADFATAAAAAGVDGIIAVDLPPEEDTELREALAGQGIAFIRFATPTTNAGRAKTIAAGSSGFIYFVAVTGVTGAGSADPKAIAAQVDAIRTASGLPVCVGFGVKTGAQAAEMAEIADGVVVGSAYVERVREAIENGHPARASGEIATLTQSLAAAIAKVAKL